jgi:hypothetical protein
MNVRYQFGMVQALFFCEVLKNKQNLQGGMSKNVTNNRKQQQQLENS